MSGTEFLIASTIVRTIGAIAAGANAQRAGVYNAARYNQEAAAARAAAAEKAKREERLGRKRQGSLRAIDPDKIDLLEDSAIEEELNVQTVFHAGEVSAIGKENSARLALAKGKSAKQSAILGAAGNVLMTGAVAGGKSSLFSGLQSPTDNNSELGLNYRMTPYV
tara:strand:- start:1731 stop:2225 length:495 start_codon:yes stop_codon:yes gene_type:complete